MKKIFYVAILFVGFCNFVFAQQKSEIQNLPKSITNEGISQSVSKISLIISKCKSGERGCRIQEIFKYNFSGGEFVSAEKILESENLPNNLDESVIYKNRYIITEFADIIDIEERQIIYNGKGFFFEIKDNLVFEIVEKWWANIRKTNKRGVFSFDLITGSVKKVKSNDIWKFRGELSPDRTKSASYEPNAGLKIYTVGEGVKFIDVALGIDKVENFCCCQSKVPLIWIDNQILLTQKQNGELVTVDLAGKVTPFANIGKEETCGPSFDKDVEGNFIYGYGKDYFIDIKSRTLTPVILKKKGNNFTSKFVTQEENTKREIHDFYYNEAKIGRILSSNVKTAPGNIAVEFRNTNEQEVYPVGIKVWNDIKGDWITFDIDWLPKVIGWVE